jgi:hypothetical protein
MAEIPAFGIGKKIGKKEIIRYICHGKKIGKAESL